MKSRTDRKGARRGKAEAGAPGSPPAGAATPAAPSAAGPGPGAARSPTSNGVQAEAARRGFSLRMGVAAAALLALFAVQGIVAARRDSVTIDEFIHLPLGLHALRTGDFRQDPINSHAPRMFAALPLLFDAEVKVPPDDSQSWGLGYDFADGNTARYQQLYVAGRSMIVLLSLVAAAVMARWAFELYGGGAALASLALFALSPSLLAHGHLVTLDMAGTLGFLLALYANWRLLDAPSLRRAAWLGLAIGVANLLKLSGFVLFAMIFATWLVRMAAERGRGPSALQWLKIAAVTGAVALLALNAGYAFDGTFGLLRDCTLAQGGKLARLAEAAPWLRLPLPRPFLDGVDMILEVGKVREPSYFLAGELSAEGWWYYHLAAFAMKCPLPVLLAALGSLAAWIAGRSTGRRDYAVFVPVLLLFAANSAFNSLYIGERHVLAAYPLLFIGIAPWIARAVEETPLLQSGREWTRGVAAAFAAVAVLLAWNAAGTAAVAPRYLQYFNEWAGGAEGGHRMLVDSNIDWGQDLLRLREWMDANKVDSVALAYFGRVDPRVYGVNYTALDRGVSHGKAVVSASFLMGRPYFWILGGRMRWVPAGTYAWLQGYRPVARVGSMFVFDLP